MDQTWNVLVVDDEADVHLITKLALKHRKWAKRGFRLTTAISAAEATARLAERDADFHVAIVDVVMETTDAGLVLCKHIRETCPASLRIILRTGQPGSAPEETVLNEHDIDYYLSKPEVTEQKLYSVVRACLRSSQDISTLLAFGKQLQSFTRALQSVSSLADLLVLMGEGLKFLELKFTARTLFTFDLESPPHGDASVLEVDVATIQAALRTAHDQGAAPLGMLAGKELGLPAHSFIIPFDVALEGTESRLIAGLYVEMAPDLVSDQHVSSFRQNAALFLENWRIAYSTLKLQERVARERLLREQMYFERLQSIANMVTGVAHEINTPLGVASTANSMIESLVRQVHVADPKAAEKEELYEDLGEACRLMTKNILRAHRLIDSFKKLSSGQLSDQRFVVDLRELVGDCLETMKPVTRKQQLVTEVHAVEDQPLRWDGFPGHLSQVIINFVQNTLRYAYPEEQGGKVDIRLSEIGAGDGAMFRIEFEDYGKGVPPEILPRLFEPFVTSGREQGGTGLGLAISHNIVTNLLLGRVACLSAVGKGTKFTIELPKAVPARA